MASQREAKNIIPQLPGSAFASSNGVAKLPRLMRRSAMTSGGGSDGRCREGANCATPARQPGQ